MKNKILSWMFYSGACVTITLNPCHWTILPRVFQEPRDAWAGPHERTWRAAWLMISVRIWIDDGAW